MSHLSNRSILEKADLALADLTAGGGLLQPAQAQKFMRLLIKQSVLLQLATVVPMASPKQQISKIKFGARVLRPGQEGTALGAVDRVKPDLSDVELDAKPVPEAESPDVYAQLESLFDRFGVDAVAQLIPVLSDHAALARVAGRVGRHARHARHATAGGARPLR